MKNSFKSKLMLIILLFGSLSTYAFVKSYININSITVKRGNSKVVKIGDTQSKLLASFGKPTKAQPYLFEMDEKKGVEVTYNGNKFYFEDDKLMGFILTSGEFNVAIENSGNSIHVGTPVGRLMTGYVIKGSNSTKAKVYDIKNADNSSSDTFLEFDYKTGAIETVTKITYSNY